MLKKIIFAFLTCALAAAFVSCERTQVINTRVVSTSGVFVLYEGNFGMPNSYDYAFIDLIDGSVYANVYQNSNNGAFLNAFPDGMMLYFNQDLFVTAQGNYAGPGTIYKINSTTNQLIASANFGSNPYSLTITNNNIYVTNLTGSSVTKLDLNLNILSSIPVGANPADLIFALGRIYVAKASYTTENSLSIIDVISNRVDTVLFNAPPVSVANNTGGLYVSTFTNRKLYIMDSIVATLITDSIDLNNYPAFVNDAAGDILAGDSRTLFVVGVDTVQFTNVGKAVYKLDFVTGSFTRIIFDPEISDIYGISYEPVNSLIYIADVNYPNSHSEIRVYNTTGQLIKTYADIGGSYAKRIVFKYREE
jgi:hypothetical protein